MQRTLTTAALALAGLAPVARAQTPAPVPAPATPPVQTPTPAAPVPAKPKLAVGDAAPALALESFVHGTPVTALEKGKTYLLHFWAPWNRTSVDQLALLADAQRRYADKGLVVLGIASADAMGTTIEQVKKTATEKAPLLPFALAWDKGSTTRDAFLEAAGRTALPCDVIVDANGKIAFLESAVHGMRFLDPILAGKHDLAAMAAWHVKLQRVPETTKKLAAAYRAKTWPDVLTLADELIEVDPIAYGGNAQARMLALGKTGAAEQAVEWARTWIDGPGKDSAQGLNAIAWVLIDPADPFPKTDLALAEKAAVRSAELTKNEDGPILDTLARVRFLQGDLAKATEIQKQALAKLKPDQMQYRAQIEQTLREYEAAAAKK